MESTKSKKTSRDLMIENNKLLKELNKRPIVMIKELEEAITRSKVAFGDFIEYKDDMRELRGELDGLKKMLRKEMRLKENQLISYLKWLLVIINTILLIWLVMTR